LDEFDCLAVMGDRKPGYSFEATDSDAPCPRGEGFQGSVHTLVAGQGAALKGPENSYDTHPSKESLGKLGGTGFV